MAKDPAVLFYTADFLAGTMTMSNEQVGQYIRLLCLQHQQGYLTEDDMMSICETKDDRVFRKFRRADDGRYYNERMLKETQARKAYSESRKRNASRKKDSGEYVENAPEAEKPTPPSDTPKEPTLLEKRFDEFWSVYPRKVGKGAARKSWAKIKPNTALFDRIMKAVAEQKMSIQWQKENGQYIPHPSTWLNQSRWEDELPKAERGGNGHGNTEHRGNTGGGFRPSSGFRKATDPED